LGKYFATDRFQDGGNDGTGNAVAAIGDDLQPAFDLHVTADAFDVVVLHVHALQPADTGTEAAFTDACVQVLDRILGQRFAAQHNLETVVVRRIVAAGHHYPGAGVQMERGKVQHRGRRRADVDDIAAGIAQTFDQGTDKIRS